jgi:MEMO1 family protein
MKIIREPAVAGMFYPSSPGKLKEEIAILLESCKPEEKFRDVLGIVVPHAGYIYSGRTASYAFNAAAAQIYKTIIIIAPSHREYFPGISVFNGDAYKTPFGTVEIDKDFREKICGSTGHIFSGTQGHRAEHAVEVQIPFLQSVFSDFTILPIVIGDQNRKYVYELSDKLAEIVTDDTLIVASSDLSHFYSKSDADRLDSIVESHIMRGDYEGLQSDLDARKCEACGGGSIVALLRTADLIRKRKSKVLARSDSGDVSGDNSEVVGYLSAIVHN